MAAKKVGLWVGYLAVRMVASMATLTVDDSVAELVVRMVDR